MKLIVKHLVIACSLSLLISCGDNKPVELDAPGIDRGNGEIQDYTIRHNIEVALINKDKKKSDEPLSYGSMDANFITIDGVEYIVDWNAKDYKNIKRFENIYFSSNGYIARVKSTGKNYRVILLNAI